MNDAATEAVALLDRVQTFALPVDGAVVAQSSLALTLGLLDGPEDERIYWLGTHEGFMVGFGQSEVTTLRLAESVYGARVDTMQRVIDGLDKNNVTGERRRTLLWASGVLTGYHTATKNHPDADECIECGRRIVSGFDPEVSCECGTLCGEGDCFNDFPHTLTCLREQRADELAWGDSNV
jgi:hypothetical protein